MLLNMHTTVDPTSDIFILWNSPLKESKFFSKSPMLFRCFALPCHFLGYVCGSGGFRHLHCFWSCRCCKNHYVFVVARYSDLATKINEYFFTKSKSCIWYWMYIVFRTLILLLELLIIFLMVCGQIQTLWKKYFLGIQLFDNHWIMQQIMKFCLQSRSCKFQI